MTNESRANNWPKDKSYQIQLTPGTYTYTDDNGDKQSKSPMPEGTDSVSGSKTITVTADSPTDGFGLIKFDANVEGISNVMNGSVASITFPYNITEVIPDDATEWTLNGITYDTTTYHAYVTVTQKDGNLSAAVTYDTDGDSVPNDTAFPVIHNTYQSSGSVTLAAKKKLENANISVHYGKFTYTLYDNDGNVVQDNIATDMDGTITLKKLSFTDADVDVLTGTEVSKTYTLREVLPDGVTALNPTTDGITYDTNGHTITLKLTDQGDGSISVTVVSGDGTVDDSATIAVVEAATIQNSYHATGTQTFQIEKTLEERPITRTGFDFELEAVGTADELSYTDAENLATLLNNMTVSWGDAGSKIDISAEAIDSVPVNGTTAKVVAESSNYGLTETASFGTIPYVALGSGTDPLQDDRGKTYIYRISEVAASNEAITYDSTVYYAFVRVTDGGNGVLTAKPTYVTAVTDDNGSTTYTAYTNENDKLIFTNHYEATGTAYVRPIKQIVGRNWTSSDAFTFLIEPYESDSGNIYSYTGTSANKIETENVPLPGNTYDDTEKKNVNIDANNDGTPDTYVIGRATSSNNAVGNNEYWSDFDKITFREGMLTYDSADGYLKGRFFYKITETGNYSGFENNTQTFYAQVDVLDNRTGTLQTTVSYYSVEANVGDTSKQDGTPPVFQNTYQLEENTAFKIPVIKSIDGRKWNSDDTFTYTLVPVGTAPMPDSTGSSTLEIKYDSDTTTTPADANTNRTNSYTIPVGLDDLMNRTQEETLTYSDGEKVPAGVRYSTFYYQITEDSGTICTMTRSSM